MRLIFILLMVVLSFSCSTSNKIIPYLLDIDVEKSIYQAIKLKENKKIEFYIERLSNNQIKIWLTDVNAKDSFNHSNRKILINDKLYSVTFDTDYLFYSESQKEYSVILISKGEKYIKIKTPSIQEREKKRDEYIYPKKKLILDHGLYWVLDEDGKLVETNFLLPSSLKSGQ